MDWLGPLFWVTLTWIGWFPLFWAARHGLADSPCSERLDMDWLNPLFWVTKHVFVETPDVSDWHGLGEPSVLSDCGVDPLTPRLWNYDINSMVPFSEWLWHGLSGSHLHGEKDIDCLFVVCYWYRVSDPPVLSGMNRLVPLFWVTLILGASCSLGGQLFSVSITWKDSHLRDSSEWLCIGYSAPLCYEKLLWVTMIWILRPWFWVALIWIIWFLNSEWQWFRLSQFPTPWDYVVDSLDPLFKWKVARGPLSVCPLLAFSPPAMLGLRILQVMAA